MSCKTTDSKLDFIEDLASRDEHYLCTLEETLRQATEDFLAEMHDKDKQYEELLEIKRNEITSIQKAVELKIRDISCQEVAVDLVTSQAEESQKILNQCLDFIANMDDEIRRLSKINDRDFCLALRRSDIKFRALLWARMNSLTPTSAALQQAQVSERDENRQIKIEHYIEYKKKLNLMAWEDNKKDLALEINLM